ncbi:heavy metal-associated domain-containing protein [Clostridium polyendosporum]|uniref:Heavy metal-associated domain-containing protein n=1 Tax=Clostridium polyendosporum TaxID=69208 RepID=A0A919VDI6_9CLOT|nr:sulfite exporter TauE/SafE family protein [Clostridium polyendosporum]GIM28049.1 heavy metal-associated domain-containing protein [Clostridium polyendosporum]
MTIKTSKINVDGMVCTSCENRIVNSIKKLDGVIDVKANYKKSYVTVTFDNSKCTYSKVCAAIEDVGYRIMTDIDYKKGSSSSSSSDIISIIGILIIAIVIMRLGANSGSFDMSSKLGTNTSYIMLFVIGIFTSLHCVGMCGGIMMSQSISIDTGNKWSNLKPAVLYNSGRVISYSILGGIVGAVGSVFNISLNAQATIAIVAGIFMIIMGFNLAGFKAFRGFSIKLPWSNCSSNNKSTKPFIVGLLNGFMPCGPLQTMQLYALATGSAYKGALSMLLFALGTVPLMLLFGLATNLLSQNSTKKLVRLSGFLVIFLGLMMANRGLTLRGVNFSPMSLISGNKASANVQITDENKAKIIDGKQIVRITADANGYTPNVVFIQKGTPTQVIFDGKVITSCNNEVIFPSLNKRKKLQKGENIIEFTPNDSKDINYSCWMGMLSGVIKVVDNLDNVKDSDISSAQNSLPPSSGAGCCGVGGDQGTMSQEPQVYGIPLSQVPTDRLIKIADKSSTGQTLTVKDTNSNFDPLVIVLNKGLQSKITFNLNNENSTDAEYNIYDSTTNNKITSFKVNKTIGTLNFKFYNTGLYLIEKDSQIQALIKVVDDIENVNTETIREELLQ